MIFLSDAERYAEIIADRNIYRLVPQEKWQDIVDRLIILISDGQPADGLIESIRATGELLAKHFPPGSGDPNEFPNHLIVID